MKIRGDNYLKKMEKINLNFDNTQNIIKSICWILSYISWLLLTINSCVSFRWLYNKKFMRIWTINVVTEYNYLPFQMYYIVIYIVFTFSTVIILLGCVYFFTITLIIKEEQIIQNIMNSYSQYHFFPILCAFFMTMLGEISTENKTNNYRDIYRAGLSISLIGLASMIFIYINTNFNKDDWIPNLLIKKGVYSCLIILFWYNFCYDIFYVHEANAISQEDINKWKKGCGLAFSIIFGLANIAFSYIFRDILYCSMNLLIYIGLVIFFNISDFNKNNKNIGDNIVDFLIICVSFILIIVLCILNQNNKNKELIVTIENLKSDSKFKEINDKIKKNRDDIKLIIATINMTPVDDD